MTNIIDKPGSWIEMNVSDIIQKISTNRKKIKQKEYLKKGLLPIIDQGSNYIGGYTNNFSKKIDCELPIIVFGDHTKTIKFINFSFAPGADGVKVIKPISPYNPKLFGFFLKVLIKKIPDKGYARHFQHIEKIRIPIPSLPEQNQIVAKIEELFSELDNGIENLKKAREQLKTYRQAVLKYAFEGKLTKEWQGKNKAAIWQEMKLGDLIKVKSGNGLTKVHQVDTGNHLVYGGNGIMGKHNKYMFEEPKLIIGRVGVHCGNVHITKPTSWVTDNAFVTNFDTDQVGMKYLLYFICDLNLKKYSSSTAQPVISGGKIYPIDVKIPGKAEQHTIISEIESRLSVCDKIEQTVEDSLKKAEALRQSILKKAFAGELTRDWREKHPELITGENSAEKLLEKIKAEKAFAAGRKKPRSRKTKKK